MTFFVCLPFSLFADCFAHWERARSVPIVLVSTPLPATHCKNGITSLYEDQRTRPVPILAFLFQDFFLLSFFFFFHKSNWFVYTSLQQPSAAPLLLSLLLLTFYSFVFYFISLTSSLYLSLSFSLSRASFSTFSSFFSQVRVHHMHYNSFNWLTKSDIYYYDPPWASHSAILHGT